MEKLIIVFVSLFVIVSCKEKKASGLEKKERTDLLDQGSDSLDYEKIYGFALKGEVTKALDMLDTLHLVGNDSTFKSQFENRFKYKTDRTMYLSERGPALRPILKIYRKYWRRGLIHENKNYDGALKKDLLAFFYEANKNEPFTGKEISDSSLAAVFDDYVKSKNLYSVGFDKTGKFYDFIVWRTMEPKTCTVDLIDDTVSVKVFFMKDFVSLGWTSYARLGNRYPGGWAKEDALYAVAKGYDRQSEKFKVNYLKHEAQHFSDYMRFPKLLSYDLEYRGKLTEMYYGNESLYDRIDYFINNAKYDPKNAHPFANYCIIKDLSQILFDEEYVKDINRWKEVPREAIHRAARKIYLDNTDQLNQIGNEVEHYLGTNAKCGDYGL